MAEEDKEYAIEKLRRIASWSNYQNESVNFQLKSITEIEKVFDAVEKLDGSEFIDNLDPEDEDDLELMKLINSELGRDFFNLE